MERGSLHESNAGYTSSGKLARAVATTTTERPPPASQKAEEAPPPLPKQQSIGALMKRYSGTESTGSILLKECCRLVLLTDSESAHKRTLTQPRLAFQSHQHMTCTGQLLPVQSA